MANREKKKPGDGGGVTITIKKHFEDLKYILSYKLRNDKGKHSCTSCAENAIATYASFLRMKDAKNDSRNGKKG